MPPASVGMCVIVGGARRMRQTVRPDHLHPESPSSEAFCCTTGLAGSVSPCPLRKLAVGFEPTTCGLQNRCSTAELHEHSCANRCCWQTTSLGLGLFYSIPFLAARNSLVAPSLPEESPILRIHRDARAPSCWNGTDSVLPDIFPIPVNSLGTAKHSPAIALLPLAADGVSPRIDQRLSIGRIITCGTGWCHQEEAWRGSLLDSRIRRN